MRGGLLKKQRTQARACGARPEACDTLQQTSRQQRKPAQATRAVLNLSFAGGRYAHAVWWLISTVAILAQGTSRAVAVTQAFYHPWLVVGRVLVPRRARCQHWGGGPPGRPSVCCQLLACAWAPVAGVGGRLLRGAWVARAFAFWAVGDRPGRPQGAASFCHQERVRERLLRACAGACCGRCCGRRLRAKQRLTQPSGCQHYCLHFSICACHPCAGAMLIFSVSFQF